MFDACRNDPFEELKKKALETGARNVALGQIGAIKALSEEEREGASVYVASGCQYGEFSLEPPELKQGLFTHYLTQGLRGYAD